MTVAEDDYRRGFHDGEAGRPQRDRSDCYAAGWRVGVMFADSSPLPTAASPRLADFSEVLAEIPPELRLS